MKPHPHPAAALALLCLTALGCGAADRTTLVLNLTGLGANVAALRVTATLEDQRTTTQEYKAAAQIGLRLPQGAKGKVVLQATGLTALGCVASRGEARGYADGEVRVDITVPLASLLTPECPWRQWDLGAKSMAATALLDPLLTGSDERGQWRCPRDDKTPRESQTAEIARRFEPNDTIPDAISYGGRALPLDNIPMTFASYEICPDRSAPDTPDVDVLSFKLDAQAKLIAEVKYDVSYGDLDIGLFLEPAAAGSPPLLLQADLTTTTNTCLSRILTPGSYFLAVRGAPKDPGEYKTATRFYMNNYRVRIYALSPNSAMACP